MPTSGENVKPSLRESLADSDVAAVAIAVLLFWSLNSACWSLLGLLGPVLRQNSMRSENSAIPSRDGCPIQVIPSPSNAKNLSRGTRAVYLHI